MNDELDNLAGQPDVFLPSDEEVKCFEQELEADRRAYEKMQEWNRAWMEGWPSHCEACDGWGGKTSRYDPSPSGVGLSPGWLYDFDPCPDCACRGLCGRCGARLPNHDAIVLNDDFEQQACASCRWNFNEGLRDW